MRKIQQTKWLLRSTVNDYTIEICTECELYHYLQLHHTLAIDPIDPYARPSHVLAILLKHNQLELAEALIMLMENYPDIMNKMETQMGDGT